MRHDEAEDFGFTLGQEIAKLQKQTSTGDGPPVVVDTPAVNVQPAAVTVEAPTVNIPVEMVAKAIEESKFDAGELVTVITKAAEVIANIDLSNLQVSIEGIDNRREFVQLTATVDKALKAMSESQANNTARLADAILSLGLSQAAHTKALVAEGMKQRETVGNLRAAMVRIETVQTELIAVAYARRDLIFDTDGNPVGLQIERRIN